MSVPSPTKLNIWTLNTAKRPTAAVAQPGVTAADRNLVTMTMVIPANVTKVEKKLRIMSRTIIWSENTAREAKL